MIYSVCVIMDILKCVHKVLLAGKVTGAAYDATVY